VLKEKGNNFFKNKEFKELAAKEGLGIARNAKGQQVLVVKTNSGTKGGWNKELNNPQPNRIYDVDDYKIYQTDELARVFKGKAEIT
jgi:filamentous hemagglutinin